MKNVYTIEDVNIFEELKDIIVLAQGVYEKGNFINSVRLNLTAKILEEAEVLLHKTIEDLKGYTK